MKKQDKFNIYKAHQSIRTDEILNKNRYKDLTKEELNKLKKEELDELTSLWNSYSLAKTNDEKVIVLNKILTNYPYDFYSRLHLYNNETLSEDLSDEDYEDYLRKYIEILEDIELAIKEEMHTKTIKPSTLTTILSNRFAFIYVDVFISIIRTSLELGAYRVTKKYVLKAEKYFNKQVTFFSILLGLIYIDEKDKDSLLKLSKKYGKKSLVTYFMVPYLEATTDEDYLKILDTLKKKNLAIELFLTENLAIPTDFHMFEEMIKSQFDDLTLPSAFDTFFFIYGTEKGIGSSIFDPDIFYKFKEDGSLESIYNKNIVNIFQSIAYLEDVTKTDFIDVNKLFDFLTGYSRNKKYKEVPYFGSLKDLSEEEFNEATEIFFNSEFLLHKKEGFIGLNIFGYLAVLSIWRDNEEKAQELNDANSNEIS